MPTSPAGATPIIICVSMLWSVCPWACFSGGPIKTLVVVFPRAHVHRVPRGSKFVLVAYSILHRRSLPRPLGESPRLCHGPSASHNGPSAGHNGPSASHLSPSQALKLSTIMMTTSKPPSPADVTPIIVAASSSSLSSGAGKPQGGMEKQNRSLRRREKTDRSKGWVDIKVAKLAREIDYQWALATFGVRGIDKAIVRGKIVEFILGTVPTALPPFSLFFM